MCAKGWPDADVGIRDVCQRFANIDEASLAGLMLRGAPPTCWENARRFCAGGRIYIDSARWPESPPVESIDGSPEDADGKRAVEDMGSEGRNMAKYQKRLP